jgi:hypothetical protein
VCQVVQSNLVDSNVFIRSLLLSLHDSLDLESVVLDPFSEVEEAAPVKRTEEIPSEEAPVQESEAAPNHTTSR